MGTRKFLIAFCITMTSLIYLAACQRSSALQANAGPDFSVVVGASPTFDGCSSTGEIVNYRWQIIKAPSKMIDDEKKIIREIETNCAFILENKMVIDEIGTWEIELEVRDAAGNTSTDIVHVEVTP